MTSPAAPAPVRKYYQYRPDGWPALRVWHRQATQKKNPRFLIKCGDCDNAVEVWYGEGSLEIGGVLGSVENWREILLPLLTPAPARKTKR